MGLNSAHQSFPASNDGTRGESNLRNLDADTKGRFVGLLGLGVLSVWIAVSLSSGLYFSIVSQHWPKTTGYIVTFGVYSSGKGVGVSWAPRVEYEYEAGGTTQRSSNIRYLMRAFYDFDAANDVQSLYPSGSTVSVSYDPQDPSRSVLEPGLPPGMWTQALIPLFFCGLCGYILFEITHPERRLLLQSNPANTCYKDEGKGGDEAEVA